MVPYRARSTISGSKQLLNGYVVARRRHTAAGSEQRARQHLQPSQRRAVRRQAADPASGEEQSELRPIFRASPRRSTTTARAVRGDMKATITAVLLDPEARANDNGGNDQPTDGHLQEPALFISGDGPRLRRPMNDQNYYSSDLANMGQDIFDAPSVFNYYSPGYGVPGTGSDRRRIPDPHAQQRDLARQRGRESVQPVFESGAKLRPRHHRRSDAIPVRWRPRRRRWSTRSISR